MNLQTLLAWWRARALRERVLLLVAGSVTVLLAADQAWTLPLDRRLRLQQAELAALQARRAQAGAGSSVHAEADAEAAPLRAREAQLRARLQAAQSAARDAERRAGDAARLPEMLRAIAGTVGAAHLLALDLSGDGDGSRETGAATAATPATTAANAIAAAAAAAPAGFGSRKLYRLPITIKVSGNWEDLTLLLGQIERHAPTLQWSLLSVDSSDWPAIQLTLKAHVTSLAARWGSR